MFHTRNLLVQGRLHILQGAERIRISCLCENGRTSDRWIPDLREQTFYEVFMCGYRLSGISFFSLHHRCIQVLALFGIRLFESNPLLIFESLIRVLDPVSVPDFFD